MNGKLGCVIKLNSEVVLLRILDDAGHFLDFVPTWEEDKDMPVVGLLDDMRNGQGDKGIWDFQFHTSIRSKPCRVC